VVSDQATPKVLRELRAAGFAPDRTAGSHTWWKHPSGIAVAVPDGHRTVSPGVYRKILAAIARSKEAK
jgi:predicted RNA binding protein YcfA (HicA-like mRNA interferase family)